MTTALDTLTLILQDPHLGDVREIQTYTAVSNRDGTHHNLKLHVQDAGAGPNRFRVLVESDQGRTVRSADADSIPKALASLRWTDLD